jgi:hypothetical protein
MSINPAPAFCAECGVETGFHVATCQTGAKERREAKELRQPVARQALVGEIDPSDLAVCWNAHLNAFIAEWDVPEDLVYTPGRPGQEPVPVLNTNDARFYARWLRFHGYITKAEMRWFYADIARAQEEGQ